MAGTATPKAARATKAAKGAASRVATPWGPATPVERVTVPQRAGERRFASVVELLEAEGGERLVRIAYTTDGAVRRGPVTLRRRDLEKLWAALAEHPALQEALGWTRS
ncbi:MAG TPA: hypothetical protein VK874_06905 [Gaiellaceae bacterium]|nr:hypothetical protein [Gaiellaceae bacterium]